MRGWVKCHVRYDPEADAAALSFTESAFSRGGSGVGFDDEAGTAGVLRLGPEGEFDHLEVLGAGHAIPQLISRVVAPPPGVRDFSRGVVEVAARERQGAISYELTTRPPEGSTYEVSVRGKRSPSPLALLRYERGSGLLRSLTLFPSGSLLRGLTEAMREGRED
ncbi:hypothetical protein [Streptomyces sp. NPDC088923]|uniref:hypothetical protein n=1 Tax=Streptomyces sp. NPDC088923 TaxID=3365913 RepID=UPI0037FC3BAE